MTRRIHIFDTTLRDGLQAPGLVASRPQRVRVARALVDLGVPWLEVGIPAMGPTAIRDVRAVVNAVGAERVVTWCRARSGDIEAAAATGAGGVHLSFPVSSLHLAAWAKTRAWVKSELRRLVPLARRHFASVSVGAQDASRADPDFLQAFAAEAAQLGIVRLRVADTVGCLTPESSTALVKGLLPAVGGIPLEFHGHNDLGLATANTLAALAAGAQIASVTVNGLGERAGNAALEQVVMAAQRLHGWSTGVTSSGLAHVCDLVAAMSRRPIPTAAPIVGAAVFSHESGLHCAGLLQDRRTYEFLSAGDVGRPERAFIIGEKTGLAALRHECRRLGLQADPTALLESVRRVSRRRQRALTEAELIELT